MLRDPRRRGRRLDHRVIPQNCNAPWQVLFEHPDVERHAFQYLDWLLDREKIFAAERTAFDGLFGRAHAACDANYLTFHRFKLPPL